MKPEQRSALRKCITHYENVVKSRFSEELGAHTCACCQQWLNSGCIDCPIFEHTGRPYCYNTPYYPLGLLEDLSCIQADKDHYTDAQFREYAQAELDFLRMLLNKKD